MRDWLYKIGLNTLPVSLLRKHLKTCASNNQHPARQKQLLIDVSAIAQNDAKTGIQRVVRNLYQQLLLSPPEGYKVCPVMAKRRQFYRHLPANFLQQSSLASSMTPIRIHDGDIFLGLDLSAHLIPHHLPAMWQWKKQGVRMTFVIYDILPVLHPEWFNPKATHNFHKWLRALAWLADSTVSISRTVQTDFTYWMQRYGLNESDIPCTTIPLGAELDGINSAHVPDSINHFTHTDTSAYILMVGTLEPRKGYDEALIAFETLWATGNPTRLIIVGKQGWKIEPLIHRLQTHAEMGKRLIWLNQVDDHQLHSLYQQCLGVLMASKGEGYGLPLIEAMQYNKPILARDIRVFRDLAQNHISYFDDQSQTCLKVRLPLWLSNINHAEAIEYPIPPTWQQVCTALSQALVLNVTDKHVNKSIEHFVLPKPTSLQFSSQNAKR